MEIDKLFIPKEIYIKIYLNLDSIYAYRLSQTCTLCYNIFSNNDQLWEKYLFEVFNIIDIEIPLFLSGGKKNNYKNTYIKCFKINKLSSIYKEDNIITIYNKTELELSYNKITSIPSEIGQLNNLQELNLSHNQITSIPSEIGQLNNLQELYLSNNQITSIPKRTWKK